jgi:hypothetical protein
MLRAVTISSSRRAEASIRRSASSAPKLRARRDSNALIRAGFPFVLFSVLASWVVGNAIEGKLKEMEAAKGMSSQSIRQASCEAEHDEMMERMQKIVEADFDNTKRIKRPHEILEERKLERQRRNAWHRRLGRWLFGERE